MKLTTVVTIVALFLFYTSVSAQKMSKAYEMYYLITLKPDSNSVDSVQEMYVNTIHQSISYFRSLEERQKDSARTDAFRKTGSLISGAKAKLPYSKATYIMDAQRKKMYYQTRVVNKVTMEQPFPEVSWTLKPGTTKIGRYTCQLATGVLGGRTYNVWFSTHLPFAAGPWKFNGLPGLAVRIADASGRIRFELMGIREVPAQDQLGLNLKNYPLTRWRDYRAAADLYNEDPVAYFQKTTGLKGQFSGPEKKDKRRKTDILVVPDNFNFLLEAKEEFF